MKLMGQLSVEHLLNTNWEDQFDVHQLREIYNGYRHGVDVLVYATPRYRGEVMQHLKLILLEKPENITKAIEIANNDEFKFKYKLERLRELH